MSASLAITIDGDGIELHSLARTVAGFADLLASIGAELASDGAPPRWEIAGLKYASPARVLTRSRPAESGADIGHEIAAACVEGVRTLGERPERPQGFSDEALERTLDLAKLTGNGIVAIEIADPEDPGGAARVTPRTAGNAGAALAGAGSAGDGGYENYGSVEGPAEAFNLHDAPFFTVWDMLTGRPVWCYFGEGDREEIARIVAGKRIVSVDGMLHHDKDGRLRRIRPVLSFEVIDEPPAGDIGSLAGLFRGIGDTREHLRRIRGG